MTRLFCILLAVILAPVAAFSGYLSEFKQGGYDGS